MAQFEIAGDFFNPRSSKAQSGVLIANDQGMFVFTFDGHCQSGELKVTSIQGSENIFFACGSYFKAHNALPQEFLNHQRGRTTRYIAWLEKFNLKKAVVLALILVVFIVLFRVTISSVSYAVAMIVPDSWEQRLGQSTYETIRDYAFEQSQLPVTQKAEILTDSKIISDSIDDFQNVDIIFHTSELFGANALAFPGGPVVVTDDLVEMMDHDEILAIIAHEYAHIHERHSLQRIVEVAAASFIAFVVFGADESVIEEISTVLIQLWGLQQSRQLEQQADLLALDYLEDAGLNPASMVTAIEKFRRSDCDADHKDPSISDCDDGSWSWLSTHPSVSDRAGYLRDAINN